MYWYVAQQQTSSLKQEKCARFSSKPNALLDELTLASVNQRKLSKTEEIRQQLKDIDLQYPFSKA